MRTDHIVPSWEFSLRFRHLSSLTSRFCPQVTGPVGLFFNFTLAAIIYLPHMAGIWILEVCPAINYPDTWAVVTYFALVALGITFSVCQRDDLRSRSRWIVWFPIPFFVAICFGIVFYFDAWYYVWKVASRALFLSVHSTLSSSYPNILRDISFPAILAYLEWRRRRSKYPSITKWAQEMTNSWDPIRKDALVLFALFFLGVFFSNVYVAINEKAEFSSSELLAYAYGVVVGIGGGGPPSPASFPPHVPSQSGFWIDADGDLVTWVGIPPKPPIADRGTLVSRRPAPKTVVYNRGGKEVGRVETTGGIEQSVGHLTSYEDTGLLLISDKGTIAPHPPVLPFGDATLSVPRLTMDWPAIGSTVFVLGVETDVGTFVAVAEGHIQRYGVGTFSTSIPFKSTYLGAPVFNSFGEIIGIVEGSQITVNVIPSSSIRSFLSKQGKVLP